MDVKFDRTSAVAVYRGLLVVRYASSDSERDFPIAVVRPAPQFERVVEIISAPGAPQGWLEKPGDCLVVRIHEAARLEIGLRRSSPSGSLDARFQIDALSGAQAAEVVAENAKTVAEPIKSAVLSSFQEASAAFKAAPIVQVPSVSTPQAPRPALSLVAHVAMRGDVEAAEDQWIAGPNAPAPVEGLLVRSADNSLLAVEMQALIAGAQQWTGWTTAGGFIGTRGRGLPLLALRLRLVGADALQLELIAEALFLGATTVAKAGRQIEFASSTGSDPLVGLKLGVRTAEAPPVAQQADGPWRDRGARVRVFRSSGV